jgi:putative nucleotidyltransferase with HDIG domain
VPVTAPEELLALRDEVAALLGAAASETWLVGGVVRDALVGRPLLDIDLATSADPEATARHLARQIGGAPFPLGDAFGCWRIADDRQFDVCALRGDGIEADLGARDFTVNAMALPLVGAPEIIDPQHGLRDLEHGTVRMVSAASIDEDPLRMLRAARIAHLFDWQVEEHTVAAIRERAARASEPAGERTFAELRMLLLHPEARRGWRLLQQLGLDATLLPELDACRGMAQSRFHHLDVHDHTLAVLDNCEDLLGATDFWLPLPDGVDREPWSEQQRLVVLLAALCHDLGKPATRQLREDGRVSFVGHDSVGAELVDALAERWRWSGAIRRNVKALVDTHLLLGFLLHTERGARERWRLLRRFGDVAAEAVVLSVGDRLATAGPDDRRRWVRAHLELAREVWADHWREQRDGRPEPLLDGQAIAQAAGIEPGPQLGELVIALAEAQAIGEVTTRAQAEELVQRVSAATGRSPSRNT